MPPRSPEYEGRLASAIEDRGVEIKGSLGALTDMLREEVKSQEDLNTLLSAAYRRLAVQEEDRSRSFLFSYIEEIERILARTTNKQCKGVSYDA